MTADQKIDDISPKSMLTKAEARAAAKEMAAALKLQQREAKKAAREAAREAKKAAREAAREAREAAKIAAKEAKEAAKKAKALKAEMEKPKYTNTIEKFDRHILNYIIENWEACKKQMRKKCFADPDYDPFVISKDYLKKSVYGEIAVTYKQNKGFGRLNAVGSRSLQSLPREIRHSIAGHLYVDVDIVNAHPVILEWLCINLGYPHEKLSYYNANREKVLVEHMEAGDDRGDVKIAYLSMTNGGCLDFYNLTKQTAFGEAYRSELMQIHKKFAEDNPEAFEEQKQVRIDAKKDYNHAAGYTNVVLCDWENKILMAMWEFYKNDKNAVLCFDGLMIPKTNDTAKDDFDIIGCQSFVKDKIGIDINLKIKPMAEGFELPDVIPLYDDMT
jgi:hypothetical protein